MNLLHVVVVLDPRNKMCYLEYCLELIYGKNSTYTKTILEHLSKTLEDLFQHFKNKTERERCEKTRIASSSTPSHFDIGHGVDMEDDFESFMEQCGHGVNKTKWDGKAGVRFPDFGVSAFSISGRVIDESRSSLTHVTTEALICAQDWIQDTRIDIQFKNMTTLDMEKTREKLGPIETGMGAWSRELHG
uniref:HAT C-terminal dimerisation domain-containing protein n=1 Tax=Lactuca sativa TaxID=4236 RepID=A0A9R1VME9_LACSA|nr:hypothetical protein LSAT_V11C400209780 [Lactuca sativa]